MVGLMPRTAQRCYIQKNGSTQSVANLTAISNAPSMVTNPP
jgi:hypothetical protein